MSTTEFLTDPMGYDVNKMIFSEVSETNIPPPPGGKGAGITVRRINISTEDDDGSVGPLILVTEECFSFGFSDNTGLDGSKNGYVVPICLYNKEGATAGQHAFVETINNIVEKCKDHLTDEDTEIPGYEGDNRLERAQLKKLGNCLYWKKEKGKVVEGVGPTLYAKVMVSKRKRKGDDEGKTSEKIVTLFYNYDDEPIDPNTLRETFCLGTFAVKVDSIFLGANITLQLKLREARMRPLETSMKRLLRPAPKGGLIAETENKSKKSGTSHPKPLEMGEEEGGDKIVDSDEDLKSETEEEQKPKKTVKKVVRRKKTSE